MPDEPGGDQSGTEVVAGLGGAADEGFLLGDAFPLAGQQPAVHLRGEPGEQRPHPAELAVVVGVHLPAGGLEQGLLWEQKPIKRCDAGLRVDAQVVVQPVGECADLDVMLGGDTVPAESHGPPAELLGQARGQIAAHRVDVGWAHENMHPWSPAVIGGHRGVEAEYVGPPAEQRSRVRPCVQQRGNDLGVEGRAQRTSGHELVRHAA